MRRFAVACVLLFALFMGCIDTDPEPTPYPTYTPTFIPTSTPTLKPTATPQPTDQPIIVPTITPIPGVYPCAMEVDAVMCGYCDPADTYEGNPMAGQCVHCPTNLQCSSLDVCEGAECVEYVPTTTPTPSPTATPTPTPWPEGECPDQPGYVTCGSCDADNPMANEVKVGKCFYCPDGTECWYQNLCYTYGCVEPVPDASSGPQVYYVTSNQCRDPYTHFNFWNIDQVTCLYYANLAQQYCSNTRWWCG